MSAVDLESFVRDLPGVIGCVILTHPDGNASEIQAFTHSGIDREATHQSILDEITRQCQDRVGHVFVFELEVETHFGDRESLERAVEVAEQEALARGPVSERATGGKPDSLSVTTGRLPIKRVNLSSTSHRSRAEVTLGDDATEGVGRAEGDKTQHGLRVLAEATLEAAGRLAGGLSLSVRGASLVSAFGRDAILVLVETDGALESLGAALVRESPLPEVAVRATLDGINRRLALP